MPPGVPVDEEAELFSRHAPPQLEALRIIAEEAGINVEDVDWGAWLDVFDPDGRYAAPMPHSRDTTDHPTRLMWHVP